MSVVSHNIEQKQISFSPPYIDEDVMSEVMGVLASGWITTGPKVKELESMSAAFTGCEKTICVNSWTSGAALVLRWLGIGVGDEVIIPAYTYAATALCILNAGAKPVMVDIEDDFTIDPEKIRAAITPATKAVIGVDFAGLPCNYDAITAIVKSTEVKSRFVPSNDIQASFGHVVVIADAAHSFGAVYKGLPAAQAADITIISLHAVKNVTTAEGGIICLNLPAPFSNEEVYGWMKLNSMNGQTKDAFTKKSNGAWQYDIVSQGMKINMPDICAAIGVAQLRKYKSTLLPDRKTVFDHYVDGLKDKDWAVIPVAVDKDRISSFHLFPLRIKGFTEAQRDQLIIKMNNAGIATNVHFIPLPMLTLFKETGYRIEDYPNTYALYANEISLPIYSQLSAEQVDYIVENLEKAYLEIAE
jgi:dTDP-4-amino-4,6-dideoxygalactose transaminase